MAKKRVFELRPGEWVLRERCQDLPPLAVRAKLIRSPEQKAWGYRQELPVKVAARGLYGQWCCWGEFETDEEALIVLEIALKRDFGN